MKTEFGHNDGMPMIFSKEVDIDTLEAGDFAVTLADGQKVKPGCVKPASREELKLRSISKRLKIFRA